MTKMRGGAKPVMGLLAILAVLVLAVACGLPILLRQADKDQEKRKEEKKDQIAFLNVAIYLDSMLSLGSSLPDGFSTAIQRITPPVDSSSMTIILVSSTGKVIENNDISSYPIGQNGIFILWRGSHAYLSYFDYPSMMQKYTVEVFDADHLDGYDSAEGIIGVPSKSIPATATGLNNLNLDEKGTMLLYKVNGPGAYLVGIVSNENQYAAAPVAYQNQWIPEAQKLVGIVFPLLVALYWLLLPFWVCLDCRRRRMRSDIWAPVVLLANLLGLAAYGLAAHRKAAAESARACAACGKKLLRSHPYCPWCGEPQEKKCPACGGAMEREWAHCPRCTGVAGVGTAVAGKPEIVMEAARPQDEERPPELPPIFMDGSPFR